MHVQTLLFAGLSAIVAAAPASKEEQGSDGVQVNAGRAKWAHPIPAPPGIKSANSDLEARDGFAGGWCGVHVEAWQSMRLDSDGNKKRSARVSVYDADGYSVWEGEPTKADSGRVRVESGNDSMPKTLITTVDFDAADVAEFSWGDNKWTSGRAGSEKKDDGGLICKVGDWDVRYGLLLGPKERDLNLDCGFSC